MKNYINMLLWIGLSLILASETFAAEPDPAFDPAFHRAQEETDGTITGIESMIFFDDLPGTFYVYFGRPTCPECVDFENHLNAFLETNPWTVYYVNTAYWKENPRFDSILRRYHVDGVPALVEIVDGDYSKDYRFRPDDSGEQIGEQLQEFFKSPGQRIYAVTSKSNYPIQFDSKLHAFTFFLMSGNLLYLFLKRKHLAERGNSMAVLAVMGNSTLLYALHRAIAGFGFNFAMRYEAGPAPGIWAAIGRYTWLTVTPIFYLIIMILGIKTLVRSSYGSSASP